MSKYLLNLETQQNFTMMTPSPRFFSLAFFFLLISIATAQIPITDVQVTRATNSADIQVKNTSGETPIRYNNGNTATPAYNYLYLIGDGTFKITDNPSISLNYNPQRNSGAAMITFSTPVYDGGYPPDCRIVNTDNGTPGTTVGNLGIVDTGWVEMLSYNKQIAPSIDGYYVAIIAVKNNSQVENSIVRVHLYYNSAIIEGGVPTDSVADLEIEHILYSGVSSITPTKTKAGYEDEAAWQVSFNAIEEEKYIYAVFPITGDSHNGLSSWVPEDENTPERHINFAVDVDWQDSDTQEFQQVDTAKISPRIVDAHDPNFLLAYACDCPDNDGRYHILGHIEFTNDGSAPAKDVEVAFQIPSTLDPATFNTRSVQLFSGGVGTSNSSLITNTSLVKRWKIPGLLLPVSSDATAKVEIDFEVKTKPNVPLSALPRLQAKVFFDITKPGWNTEDSKLLIAREGTDKYKSLNCSAFNNNCFTANKTPCPPDTIMDHIKGWKWYWCLALGLLLLLVLYYFVRGIFCKP